MAYSRSTIRFTTRKTITRTLTKPTTNGPSSVLIPRKRLKPTPGMLKTFDLRGRDKPLAIHGPPGLRGLLGLVMRMAGRVGFELEVRELEAGDVLQRDGYRIAPVPVSHRGPAIGYVRVSRRRSDSPVASSTRSSRRRRSHRCPTAMPITAC